MVKFLRRVGVAALGLALGSAGLAPAQPAGDVARVRARGRLIMLCFPHQDSQYVAVDLSRGPMKKVGTTGDFKGLDVDLMAAFAQSLGVTLEIRPVSVPSYDELLPALEAGAGDLIASSFSITAARAARVDFSDPYFVADVVVIAPKTSQISDEKDLRGKIAAVIPGSSQEEYLHTLGLKDASLRYVEFARDEYLLVESGKADFTMVDGGKSISAFLAEFGSLKIAFKMAGGTRYGIAVRKGSDLRAVLNAYLAEAKAAGTLAGLLEKWNPGGC